MLALTCNLKCWIVSGMNAHFTLTGTKHGDTQMVNNNGIPEVYQVRYRTCTRHAYTDVQGCRTVLVLNFT